MITCCSLNQLPSVRADTRYAIVRSMKRPVRGVEQLPVLSPSRDLFFGYLDLRRAEQWDQAKFDSWYAPIFLREMQSPAAAAELDRLAARSAAGEDIALACFCRNPDMCHRSLTAALLMQRGAQVQIM